MFWPWMLVVGLPFLSVENRLETVTAPIEWLLGEVKAVVYSV